MKNIQPFPWASKPTKKTTIFRGLPKWPTKKKNFVGHDQADEKNGAGAVSWAHTFFHGPCRPTKKDHFFVGSEVADEKIEFFVGYLRGRRKISEPNPAGA